MIKQRPAPHAGAGRNSRADSTADHPGRRRRGCRADSGYQPIDKGGSTTPARLHRDYPHLSVSRAFVVQPMGWQVYALRQPGHGPWLMSGPGASARCASLFALCVERDGKLVLYSGP